VASISAKADLNSLPKDCKDEKNLPIFFIRIGKSLGPTTIIANKANTNISEKPN
jgi:hypothetical protein